MDLDPVQPGELRSRSARSALLQRRIPLSVGENGKTFGADEPLIRRNDRQPKDSGLGREKPVGRVPVGQLKLASFQRHFVSQGSFLEWRFLERPPDPFLGSDIRRDPPRLPLYFFWGFIAFARFAIRPSDLSVRIESWIVGSLRIPVRSG